MVARRFVVVSLIVLATAAACSKKKKSAPEATGSGSAAQGSGPALAIVGEWNVNEASGQCGAYQHGTCPPDVACDPPPPRAIVCPPGAAEGVRVVELADKTCAVAPADCKDAACLGAKTPCPLPEGEALPPLAWAVTTLADGTCRASWSGPGSQTHDVTIQCPVADAKSYFIRRASADAPCFAEPEGKDKVEVACPAPPKSFTVAALRDAFAKDKAAVYEQRVRIQGFSVFAMGGSTISGKVTTYSVGASDTKDDTKVAIKCFSTVPFPEFSGGDPIVVEGVVKGNTLEEMVLVACRATTP